MTSSTRPSLARASLLAIASFLLLSLGAAAPGVSVARAFCGFYVSPAEGSLYNDASMVVLMREGNRTVLSMRNTYQGPPEDFAMVVPVPVVLQQENVRTLRPEVFDHIDRLAAPRLVEYWEQDPCYRPPPALRGSGGAIDSLLDASLGGASSSGSRHGVRIEAQFAVGEYDIVILSARDSTGLETWLRQENYRIPQGAAAALRPYVQAGTKFFVARVNVGRVRFEHGRAQLSPLRVHYDSPTFSLPVRLGMINSRGTQDLIVHVLARGRRYEVANAPNALIPTNVLVSDRVRRSFGSFYATLFDKTLERNPGAVVTEYAWSAGSCDPCPTGALSPSDLATFGGDVIFGERGLAAGSRDWVLTRLHARYTQASLADDLVFRAAAPVIGGRGMPDRSGQLGQDITAPPAALRSRMGSSFQGRYAILHHWRGPMRCANPQRGVWGGPPRGQAPAPAPALDLAFQRRSRSLRPYLRAPIPALGISSLRPVGRGPRPNDPWGPFSFFRRLLPGHNRIL